MTIRNSEFVFVKSVKDGIPNRDPLNDSDARRLFPEEDGRISLSDVSIKRDVRDYVLASQPDGGPDKKNFIFVQQVLNEKGKLLGRGGLAEKIAADAGQTDAFKKDPQSVLLNHSFDVRTFGIVYSVKNVSFHLTGPVQFGWAHSMHPVDTQYVQGTVVMPSTESAKEGEEGKSQGTIWTTYTLPFAVFVMPGVINSFHASKTGMTEEDQELLLKALWQGTQHRQARGRGLQQSLFLIHVEYHDPHYRIGYLEDLIRLLPERDAWINADKKTSSLNEITLDVSGLMERLEQEKDRIARCRIWVSPSLAVKGNIDAYRQPLW